MYTGMRTYFSQRYVDVTDSDVDLKTSYKVPAIYEYICVLILQLSSALES